MTNQTNRSDLRAAVRRAFTWTAALLFLVAAGPVATLQGQSGDDQAAHDQAAHDHASHDQSTGGRWLQRETPYADETIAAFERLPIQDAGRVKPLLTYARFLLLQLAEKTSLGVPDGAEFGDLAGGKLGPAEWALDVMLFPRQADHYPCFLIADRDLFDRIGRKDVAMGKRKRDRYSFLELQPALGEIQTAARRAVGIPEKQRDRLDGQLVMLYHDLSSYVGLRSVLAAAGAELDISGSSRLQELFGGADSVRYSEALRQSAALDAAADRLSTQDSASMSEEVRREAARFLGFNKELVDVASRSGSLTWLPPSDQRAEAWLDPFEVFNEIRSEGPAQHHSQIEALALLERVVDAADIVRVRGEHGLLAGAATGFVEHVREMSVGRSEGEHVETEVGYYRTNWLFKAWMFFVLGTVLAPLGWVFLRSRWALLPTWILVSIGEVLLIIGITYRCIIRDRPPVSTLYETFLLVTAGGVLVAMAAELFVRKRIALPTAAVFGTAGMWAAELYEFTKGVDTMPQLQAVLDTNFYLSIHVTTVTLGYMASLLAGLLGAVYLIGRLFSDNGPVFRAIGRIVYGVLCLGLLLSTFGTIMGGIWANDSWGRFWGWDPKENGALMIVLWQLLILHARMGGYIRNWGMSMLAVFGNIIVAYSWFGVNLMAVGLHSYGFDASLSFAVNTFYISQLCIMALGAVALFLMRDRESAAKRQREADAVAVTGKAT